MPNTDLGTFQHEQFLIIDESISLSFSLSFSLSLPLSISIYPIGSVSLKNTKKYTYVHLYTHTTYILVYTHIYTYNLYIYIYTHINTHNLYMYTHMHLNTNTYIRRNKSLSSKEVSQNSHLISQNLPDLKLNPRIKCKRSFLCINCIELFNMMCFVKESSVWA